MEPEAIQRAIDHFIDRAFLFIESMHAHISERDCCWCAMNWAEAEVCLKQAQSVIAEIG